MNTKSRAFLGAVALLACAAGVSCTSPMERTLEQRLREELVASNRQYLKAVAAGPVIELTRKPSEVEAELTPERRAELDRISGVGAYTDKPIELGPDLLGGAQVEAVAMSLEHALKLAARNNLDVEQAAIVPAINLTRVVQAEAVFDAVLYSNLEWEKLDTPQPVTTGGLNVFGKVQQETTALTTGIRKPLTTGGQAFVQTRFARNFRDPSFFAVKTYYDADVTLGVTQPLLRNFGADVNRATILLNQSALRQSVQELHAQLLNSVAETERAYWNLVYARQLLLIRQRLLERTIVDRNQLKERAILDVSPVQLTEANSFVELRRADVIRARQQVRLASDQLKRLINAPELPVAGETLIVPLESLTELPIQFSLLDAVRTALAQRPELRQALLQIEDTSIRQRVADNARLPRLDLAAQVRYRGLGSNIDEGYDSLGDGEFIDYILGAEFEVPIGNRGPEALYEQRKLERRAAVIAYRNAAQQVVLEVKDALRQMLTTYELIGAARAARRAAADNIRAIEAQEDAGVALTPEFLNLKLDAQGRLADAENQEVAALTDYNAAIANLYRAMGTLLERNGIEFSEEPVGEKKKK